MLSDMLSHGLDQVVEWVKMRIKRVVNRLLISDNLIHGPDMLRDILSCGMEQLVEQIEMRIQ